MPSGRGAVIRHQKPKIAAEENITIFHENHCIYERYPPQDLIEARCEGMFYVSHGSARTENIKHRISITAVTCDHKRKDCHRLYLEYDHLTKLTTTYGRGCTDICWRV